MSEEKSESRKITGLPMHDEHLARPAHKTDSLL